VGTWTARTPVRSDPDEIFAILTDPDAAAHWSPVPFEVDELDGERLEAGGRAVLSGRLAGRRIRFDVEVVEAEDGRLSLVASGPVDMDVEWRVDDRLGEWRELVASVNVRAGRGLGGRLLSSATEALLRAGSLQAAVASVAEAAEYAPLALAA
jgi:Polyketide cyclase / dehydrase and lipid transport